MVHYDPLTISNAELQARIKPLLSMLAGTVSAGRHWRLPACYDAKLGLDLAEVAGRTGLSEAEVVVRHSTAPFRVYMVGFLPGFAYLGGLPAALELPRRENPRLKVEAGSIAIAMAMSVIYSIESPGAGISSRARRWPCGTCGGCLGPGVRRRSGQLCTDLTLPNMKSLPESPSRGVAHVAAWAGRMSAALSLPRRRFADDPAGPGPGWLSASGHSRLGCARSREPQRR